MEDKLQQDLKSSLLAGDKARAGVLRGLKNALQYETVDLGLQASGLNEEQIQKVLSREAKKRQEAADMYSQAGEKQRATAELAEKAIIEEYLPKQLDEAEVSAVVTEEIAKQRAESKKDMGKVIAAIRARLGARADGALVARLVKQALEKE